MDRPVENFILQGPLWRALLKLAVPIVLGNLLQMGYQFTDAFWVGRLGGSAVAAVALTFPVTFLVIALGSGFAMAGAVMVARHAGAGRQDMVDQVAGQTMVMVVVISALLGAIGYALAPDLVKMLGTTEQVREDTLGFMRVSFIGVSFVFTYAMFQALMRGIGHQRLPLIIVAGTVLLNFVLDPLFIFGWGPVPGAGVVGAAAATVVTQAVAAVAGIAIFLQGRHGIHLTLANLRPDAVYMRTAFLMGLPVSIDLSTRALGLVAMSFLVAGFGTLPTAVYGVGSTIMQFATVPAAGVSAALTTLVGQCLGAGDLPRAERFARLGIWSGFALLSALGIVAFASASQLVTFFVPGDPEVIGAGTAFVRIIALGWGGIGIQLCVVAVLRASGKMTQAMVIALATQWAVQFPIAFLLSRYSFLHADGIWWSFLVSNLATAVFSLAWFATGQWKCMISALR